ncbi:MAG: four helix bundle protein [Saprospiraceae bacterium]|nr:four helix bundle protein [Saprospiraceae bacterium]
MDFKDLHAYKLGFELAMDIFKESKGFLKEETYSLTDQIRRSSRSVCANIAEAYRKRQYPAHFASKLSDSDAENAETLVWLDFALECEYFNKNTYELLTEKNRSVGNLIGFMIRNPEKFGVKK